MTEKNANKDALFREREKLILDAVALKESDRVPVTASFYFFPARYYGHTIRDVMYDPEKLFETHVSATLEFQPDLAQNPFGLLFLGPLLEALDYRQMEWAGGTLGPDVPFQFVEGEYMKADEYDHFFSDPTDFIVRKYWPRISGAFGAFERLPSLKNFTGFMGYGSLGMFASPEMQQALDTVKRAGQEAGRIATYARRFEDRMHEEGFPTQGGGMAQAPFDLLGDFLRGTKGLMIDMYRRPEIVRRAVEMLLPLEVERGITTCRKSGSKLVFIALHKGLDGFMSPEQFKKFYWPTLRELVLALIDAGCVPYLFWEGVCTSRLDTITDIPPGKAMYRFEATDMFKAKDALRDRVCIRGNVPVSILATGTPDDVKAYCKRLIDYVGKGGGFLMDSSAGVTDARPENLRAMFEFSRQYGRAVHP
ncbi:MAG TPA: uroporphyrinogen decarboxylase family protein [Syntrophorhabdales bacterium]|nr:uroporphyrinogen decarboxylase family protein [Syntrophorhabdales bacterium]